MDGLIEIRNDLFDIAARLTSVNENYRLYYNKKSDRYEVHNIAQKPLTLAFVVPYSELDARTVEYARFSAVQNAEKVFADIEKSNEKLEKEVYRRTFNRAMSTVEGL